MSCKLGLSHMRMKENLLSRNNSLVLRGAAIMFIMLHNFLHIELFGFSGENEMSFLLENANSFYDALLAGTSVIGEFFSHLGWIGVPVFVFLTGYGAACTDHPVNANESCSYIKRNYIKLLALMLPAFLFFAGIDILKGDIWPDVFKRASYLTMLSNFVYPYIRCTPGVYWYFGLTFQLYLLWALLGKRMNGKNLLVWSIIFLFMLFVFCAVGSPNALSIFRHCFTGWFPVFALGVWFGKSGKDVSTSLSNIWIEIVLFFVLLSLILIMSKWMLTWLFIPIVALVWFLIVGLLLIRTRYLSMVFRWLGRLSACIFVCHPIARLVVRNVLYPRFSNLIVNVLAYTFLTIIISLFYGKIYQWLLAKMRPKTI